MASDCCCYWFGCLSTVSVIINDNALNHSRPTNIRLLKATIPTLRPYSCFRLKRIKKRSSQIENDNDHHHRRSHQKHHQQNIDHKIHDVAPQMPKRKSSQENLLVLEFYNENTNHNNNIDNDVRHNMNIKNCLVDNYHNNVPIQYSTSPNTSRAIHNLNEMTVACRYFCH